MSNLSLNIGLTLPEKKEKYSLDIINKNNIKIDEELHKLDTQLQIDGEDVYLDYQDGKYGINTDPKRGADTFIPFRSNNVEDDSNNSNNKISNNYIFNWNGTFGGGTSSVTSHISIPNNSQKLIIKNIDISGYKSSSSAPTTKIYMYIRGKELPTSTSFTSFESVEISITSTETVDQSKNNVIIDLNNYKESFNYIVIYLLKMTSTSTYNYHCDANCEISFE